MGNEHEGPADEVGIANAELERRAALLLLPEDTPETLAALVRAPLVAADPDADMDAEADADVDADAVGAGTDAVGAGTDADVEDSAGVVAIKAEAVDVDDKSEVTNPLLSIALVCCPAVPTALLVLYMSVSQGCLSLVCFTAVPTAMIVFKLFVFV